MSRQLAILFLSVACVLSAGMAAVAGGNPGPAASAAPVPEVAETAATAAPRAQESLTPCQQAIRELLEREATQLAELEARLPAAADAPAFLALQRQIEQVKQATELQVMRTQAEFARREGRVEQAEQIEAALAEMSAPRQPSAPAGRADAGR